MEKKYNMYILDIKEELSKQAGMIIDPPDEEIIFEALKLFYLLLKRCDIYVRSVENKKSIKA